jgi:hypothetical protein
LSDGRLLVIGALGALLVAGAVRGSRSVVRPGRGVPLRSEKRWKKMGTRLASRLKRAVPGGAYVIHRRNLRAPYVYELVFIPDEARLGDKGVLDQSKVVRLGRFPTNDLANEASDLHESAQGSRATVRPGRPPGVKIDYLDARRRFKPVNPSGISIQDAIAGRTGKNRSLSYDAGSWKELRDVPGYGLYLNRDWSKMQLYAEFTVNGHRFVRRIINESVGNFGVLWASIGGTSYQLGEH